MLKRPLAALLIAALACSIVPVMATADTATASADDDIPGVSLPASPVSGSLQGDTEEGTQTVPGTDVDDVYAVDVPAGATFWAQLDGAADFDLYIYGANATSVAGSTRALSHSENFGTSFEQVRYTASTNARLYLDVCAFSGGGDYTIDYGFATKDATLSVTASSTCGYAVPASVSGYARGESDGKPVKGMRVHLWERPTGSSTYRRVTSAVTDEFGAYSFSVMPKKTTTYKVTGLGAGSYLVSGEPKPVSIKPTAQVSTPNVPSPMRAYRTYTVTGTLRPYDSRSKSVKIRCYKWDGKAWVWKKTVVATNSKLDASTTKYRASLSLPRGYWRIKAFADAGYGVGTQAYASAWAPASRYRTIK